MTRQPFVPILVLLFAAVFAATSAAPAAARAASEPVSQVIEGTYLRLISSADPKSMMNMLPGDEAVWDVSISADAPDPGLIDIGLSGTGTLGLAVEVRGCASQWRGAECPSGEAAVFAAAPVDLGGRIVHMLSLAADDEAHLRLLVSVPDSLNPEQGTVTELRVHADGYSEALVAGPPTGGGELPSTGLALSGIMVMAVGAVIVGISGSKLLASRRRVEATS